MGNMSGSKAQVLTAEELAHVAGGFNSTVDGSANVDGTGPGGTANLDGTGPGGTANVDGTGPGGGTKD